MRFVTIRLATCLLALMPQQVCACHWIEAFSPVAAEVWVGSDHSDELCHCPCHDESPACSHIENPAVADEDQDGTDSDRDQCLSFEFAPLPEISSTTAREATGSSGCLGRVPIYLQFCSLRN